MESELRQEMLALWDAVLAAGFGVDPVNELPENLIPKAVSMWRDAISQHEFADEMEAMVEKVLDEWPD